MLWRRAKRLAWITAWAVWAFAGWRLYVELPRSLGPPIAKLDLESGENALGFLDGEATIVTAHPYGYETAFVRVWDAASGAVRGRWRIAIREGRAGFEIHLPTHTTKSPFPSPHPHPLLPLN